MSVPAGPATPRPATPVARQASSTGAHPARRLLAMGAASLADPELLSVATGLPPATCLALVDQAGGLPQLAARSALELRAEHGLDRSQAAALAAQFELGRRVTQAVAEPGWRVRSPADVGERLVPAMRHLEREELRVLLLNTKNVVTACATVYVGNLAGSSVRVGEVFRDAVRALAAAIVVVHNHPSGDPSPSAEDLRITAELAEAGRLLDIELLDHVVVAANGWVSLRAMGLPGNASPTRRASVAG